VGRNPGRILVWQDEAMTQAAGQGRVELVQAGLDSGQAEILEDALIEEMDARYGSGGPGPVHSDGFVPPDGYFVLAAASARQLLSRFPPGTP